MLYFPAIFALLFKFFLFYYGGKTFAKNKSSKTLLALLIVMTMANIVEIVSFQHSSDPESFDIFLRLYYVSLMMMFSFLVQLSLLVIYKKLNNAVDVVNFGISTLICFLLLFTDHIIAGATSIGYSVTRIPGDVYWIVQIYSLTMLLISLGLLTYGYKKSDNLFTKIRALYILFAVFCLALPIIITIALMTIGFKVNATLILPIGITLFLSLITYAIKNDKLFDIRVWLPFTTRYRLIKAIYSEFQIAEDGSEMTAKERLRNHEKIFLLKALLDYKGYLNQKEIAEKMGISESSLSKKRKEYGI